MAAVVVLSLAFLICQVNAQILGLGPTFTIPRAIEPCATEAFRSPVCIDPCGNIQVTPNLVSVQPILNTIPPCHPCSNVPAPKILNLPAPSCIQNQVPICNQPVINPVPIQTIISNALPKCPNVQTPICINTPTTLSTIANPSTPVVTVVDNTLANSLANALQLLILSNILENTETCNLANLPCINNYEIVTPDLIAPSKSCEYCSNVVCPDPIVSIAEPVLTCQEPILFCSEPSISCPETIYQAYPTNYGFQCGPSPLCYESSTQYEPIVPISAGASVPPMALEVPFPASIPAQLTCNLGILPSNQPCVTFNVEPFPCNNVFGNYGNFM